MKLGGQGCLKLNQGCLTLTNQGCLLPLLRRRVSAKGRPVRINGDDDDDDDLEVNQTIVITPPKEQSESAAHNKPPPPTRINFRQETPSNVDSETTARLTLAKFFAILRDAYVCTMMSFATKGGLGAVTMGGNINLPSSVPARPAVKPAIMSS
ncbi:hypothetical protein MPTK1_8g02890 [Marchantia polymorpha subsp. ruderalis]|uniref:Uncharacterized protein n=1 Tax=Marchantia polymorpha TaxID=3197 RepID=A0A2R6XJ71_MARPO|nr:hypothetical protein MARPO_0012s0082 [Marchantia polymorpha]BBN18485.1 hypothetical protein Mp_8g02890 [Marchantia polymorpha subsp. ruderalis]PTQ46130.1 hypothetical protein MARPO_0012s0082 [Marchantia polymorpha]PTQ46131.1 hypothetical protein MARPO_0012s0082 [Marchantia polymorpha]BBN18486.1 hypothetical protein Mp_8g02890 [Marchantia polymorpha subsp. ruderalis]|eukprot:PTQ46129.1 hypothetical protein MARPO_0012s0082 [Marchantia polymorpha]